MRFPLAGDPRPFRGNGSWTFCFRLSDEGCRWAANRIDKRRMKREVTNNAFQYPQRQVSAGWRWH